MINALWRFVLTLVFMTSLLLVLAIIWDIPQMMGYPLPGDFAKLPATLLTILALVTGLWGTWSRSHVQKKSYIQTTGVNIPIYPPRDTPPSL